MICTTRWFLAIAVVVVGVAASVLSADAVTLKYGDKIVDGGLWDGTSSNRGTTLTFGAADGLPVSAGTLTIKAVSGFDPDDTAIPDVLAAATNGTIFWGDLGGLDATCTSPYGAVCIGLGVQDSGAGGSKGISGDGGDSNEALIFSFSGSVAARSVSLTLVGINTTSTDTMMDNSDVIDFWFEWLPADPGFDSKKIHASIAAGDPTVVNFGSAAFDGLGLDGQSFGSFAILAERGHFGVRGISVPDSVPEPGTLMLLGFGLAGLGSVARRISHRRLKA